MGKRNKPFNPIVNNKTMPDFRDKHWGFKAFIVILIIGLISALGYGVYIIVKNPKESLIMGGLLLAFWIANLINKWVKKSYES